MREAAHWSDGLVSQIVVGGGVVLDHLAILGVDSLQKVCLFLGLV